MLSVPAGTIGDVANGTTYTMIGSDQRFTREELVEKLNAEAEKLTAKDYHYLAKCHDAKNTIKLWEIMARTSLMRQESRGDHYREDYPLMDNDNWLKWVIVSEAEGKIKIVLEDIPFEERNWKYRPEPGTVDLWRKRNAKN